MALRPFPAPVRPLAVCAPALVVAIAALGGARSSAAGPISPEERARLAERFAPELRFNAWFEDRDPSAQNVTEDFLPMDVERFLAALERREADVVVRRSARGRPAHVRRERFQGPVEWRDGALRGYPTSMAGDPAGSAPIYADVYPDRSSPGLAFAEFWSFYPYDFGDARVLGLGGGIGGHRGDWEHIEVVLERGAGCVTITGAIFPGHEHALYVPAAAIEIVDGTHPVVYVGQGKHPSYPEPGEWRDYLGVAPLARYDDVFHGNGARVKTWRAGGIVDIARARTPHRFWLDWPGLFGPDYGEVLGVVYLSSPVSPWIQGEDYGATTGTWTDAKATHAGIRCDRDIGLDAPRRIPPEPIRVGE